jgi:hypothetical protein
MYVPPGTLLRPAEVERSPNARLEVVNGEVRSSSSLQLA